MARLIGPSNEATIEIEGQEVKADTGANMSCITKQFTEELGLEIHSINKMIDIEGTGGGIVPYFGYVECRLNIPEIEAFDQDVLMLVINNSPYGARVPIQLGTLHLDMAMRLATDQETKRLNRQWRRAEFSTRLGSHQTQATDSEPSDSIDLEHVTGTVLLSDKQVLRPFETIVISGIMKGPVRHLGISKRVNVLTEPVEKQLREGSVVSAVPCYTYLTPGSGRVKVMLKNLTSRSLNLNKGDTVAELKPGNVVPEMLAPKDSEMEAGDTRLRSGEGVRGLTSQTGVRTENVENDPKPNCKVLEGEQLQALYEKLDLEKNTSTWEADTQAKAFEIVHRYSFLFAMDSLDLGRTDLVQHHITLTDYTPIKDRYRRIPPHQYDEVRKHLKEMMEIGAIRRSNSPRASPVVLVRKKDGALRFCIDLRRLNARTVKDAYSLPRIEDALDSLNGACLFTSLDLKSGYWQVELDPESVPLTAFTVGPLGFFECTRMPFGLTNAPATFQRLMESCLGELHLDWCIIYLDDIIIFSKTPEEHLTRLEAVFERLAAAGLKLKPSKCELFQTSLKYLGHIVSEKGIATDPTKIEAIRNWPVPKTVTDVRSFAGFTNYYRKFIKDYAKVARPLNELISGDNAKKKRQLVQWNEKCQEAFEKLKQICMNSPVLAYADYQKPFVVHTDASTLGLGAVLSQRQEDGKERVIAYASQTLNKAEQNYDAHKLEFLTLKWAITDRFHEYLYGSTFDVFTDNNPLTYILSTAKLDAMGHRWVARLGPYNFSLFYKPGKINPADALSRIPWNEVGTNEVKAVLDLSEIDRTGINLPSLDSEDCILSQKSARISETRSRWVERQRQDGEIAFIYDLITNEQLDDYHMKPTDSEPIRSYLKVQSDLLVLHGLIYRKIRLKNHDEDTYQFLVPKEYRNLALKLVHDSFGHLGIDRTTAMMQARFFWPKMADEIRTYIRSCARCFRFKQTPEQEEMVSVDATYPLQLVHMDFLQIGSKRQDKGRAIYVLVITDHFTRYAKAYVTTNQTAQTVAKTFLEQFVVHYGWPEKILTDQARDFEGKVFKRICQEALIKKLRTTPYHPQGNGQPERFNRTLLSMLGTLPVRSKKRWQHWVATLTHAYNCSRSRVTGFSPYFLMYGREPRIPVDEEFGVTFPLREANLTQLDYVKDLKERLQVAYKIAQEQIDKDATRRKLYYDRKFHCMEIVPGDLVLVHQKVYGSTKKIEDRWENPVYKVVQRLGDGPMYRIQKLGETNADKVRDLHRNMIFPVMHLVERDDFETDCQDTEPTASKAAVTEVILSPDDDPFMASYFDADWA